MIDVDQRSRLPIYEQIVEGITRQVLFGVLGADEQLPSVRTLATRLAVNPNTVQKAYQALEENGVIYSVPGKGSFASPEIRLSETARRRLLRKLELLLREAAFFGLPFEDAQETLRSAYRPFIPPVPPAERAGEPQSGAGAGGDSGVKPKEGNSDD